MVGVSGFHLILVVSGVNPFTAIRDCNFLKFVVLADQIPVTANEMST